MRPDHVPLSSETQTARTAPPTPEPSDPVATTAVAVDTGDEGGGGADAGGVGLGVVIGLCVLVAGVAGLVGWFAGLRHRTTSRSPRHANVATTTTTPEHSNPEPAEVVDPARKRLVDGIISVRDFVDNPALSDRLGQLLDSVGVTTIDPRGAKFDPGEHQAQAPPTLVDDRSLDGTIADVISFGYRERGSITRFPVVVVYRYSDGAR